MVTLNFVCQVNSGEFVELTTVEGVLEIKDQLKEYIDRGPELATTCLLDFFLNTYEREKTRTPTTGTSRQLNERVPYLQNTGHGCRCRVVRTAGHETMPNFVGEWFPRNDVPELQEYYHASMLALLTPWRHVEELKPDNGTFKGAYDDFVAKASPATIRIIENIQYQYECSDSAKKKRDQRARDDKERSTAGCNDNIDIPTHVRQSMDKDESSYSTEFDQQDVDNTLAAQFSTEDRLFAEVALNIAFDKGIFDEKTPETTWKDVQRSANEEDMVYFQELEKMVKLVTKNRHVADKRDDILPDIASLRSESLSAPEGQMSLVATDDFTHVDILNTEQRLAHDIVSNHLKAHLDGRKPKQLLMIVMGQGGTGKSTLLNALTTTFDKHNASHLLGKTAMSGIAASLIGGTTLHWYGGLPPQMNPQSDIWPENSSKYIKDRRAKNLQPIEWLAIDEMGMCTLDFLTLLSQVAGKARVDNSSADATIPFGDLNLILIGDFHQFPPVGAASSALYCPAGSRNTSAVGKAIYLQFETVVNLLKQERIKDIVWKDILQRSREGQCTAEDIDEIRKLILTNATCENIDFTKSPWDTATLVTPRNCVRAAWNRQSLRKHCAKTGNILYICDAEDTIGNDRRPTNFEQKVIIAGMSLDQTRKIGQRIEFAIGMQVMVTLNVSTEADLANGSRGTIEDVVLDPRELVGNTDRNEDGEVWLEYPPAMILFRPFHYEFDPFPGLQPGLIPIFPSEVNFTIHYQQDSKAKVIRRQFPICAGYAFTDHKAQGQTLEHVIVDIGTTVKFPVNPFAAYVALSRSRGRDTIRLLRDFDETIFTKHPSEYLRREDERLAGLVVETADKFKKGWYNYN
jgi:hypothetical protein